MTILIFSILLIVVIDSIAGEATPWDVKMYYADKWDTPLIGGIRVWLAYKKIL